MRKINSVKNVSITVLVDNKADLIVKSSDHVKYFTDKPLLAEHGFACLVQAEGAEGKILWDAGVSEVALIENMHRMELDYCAVSVIALSHGHADHYGAMTAMLNAMQREPEEKDWGEAPTQQDIEDWFEGWQIPLVAHPAAFRERWWMKADGKLAGPALPPPTQAWQAAGAKIILSEGPYELVPGCWTTGYVPRKSFEKSGRPTKMLYRNGPDFIPDDQEDDQAIVINVRDKGLIVLSGCAHSGIVNTVEHARVLTGIDRVYAIIGGFHLARAKDTEIKKTIQYLKSLKPEHIVPSHCTGFRAQCQIAQAMPEAFIEGIVGTTFLY